MPAQTALNPSKIYFPDGAKIEYKVSGGSFIDLGVIEGDSTATFEYDVNQVTTGNAGKTAKQYKNMKMTGEFTLNSIDPVNIAALGGGLFTATSTAGTPLATIPDQIIAANWSENVRYALIAKTSSSDAHEVRLSAKPVFTSVKLGTGSPETLTEDTDYVVVADASASSGYAIQFIAAGMSAPTPKIYAITIDWGTNTPIASSGLTCGTTTAIGSSVEMRYTHTDSAGKKRYLYMPKVQPESGSFVFGFKGANSDGLESMPFKFTADLETTVTDGAQLFTWVIEDGAQ